MIADLDSGGAAEPVWLALVLETWLSGPP
jgi:hypothetical protein